MTRDKPILITGAAGFLGRDLVARMLMQGFHVRAMLRDSTRSPFPSHERFTIVQADMRDQESLAAAVQGCAAIVHLAAAKSDEDVSEEVNVGGARRLVKACEREGCRLINISTQSTKIARKGIYARTKRAADEVFHRSGLAVTSLLPSVVYGEENGGVFGTILQFVRKAPLVVVLGDGNWLSAPVYVGDVSAAVIACLDTPCTIGNAYDIGGPDEIRFDALIDRIAILAGRSPPKLHIPFQLALWIARIVALLPKAPITVSNVLGSNQDTQIDIEPARRDFGFTPRSLDDGLKQMVAALDQAQAERAVRTPTAASDECLADDCRTVTRYLIDRPPTADLITRYAVAVRLSLSDPELGDTEWQWVRRHPGALPYLDAATGLLRPRSLLRQRVYLMTAILETAPAYCDNFLPPPRSAARLIALLIWNGTQVAIKAIVGAPLLIWARRFG